MAATKLPAIHNDGFQNLFTMMGTNKDRNTQTTFGMRRFLDQRTVEALYNQNGLARRLVNLPADDLVRGGWKITEDADDLATKYLNKLGFKKELKKLLRWNRLYGGSLMVIGAMDGRRLEESVNQNGIRSIEFIRVYDRYQVYWTPMDYVLNPDDPNFGQVMRYQINPVTGGTPYTVHASRCIRLDGMECPDYFKANNFTWGLSIFEYLWEELANRGTMNRAVVSIVDDFVTTTMTVKNLQQLLATGQEAVVKKRLDMLDMSKHVLNTALMDENETFEKKASTVTGLADLLINQALEICAMEGIPYTLLFGKSAAGMNATGESDIRLWYDKVEAEQPDVLDPILNVLYSLAYSSQELGFSPKEDWSVKYNPLWKPTTKEVAEIRKAIADADKIYLDAQVLSPDEVAESRFGSGEFSSETHLEAPRDPAQWDEPPPPPVMVAPATPGKAPAAVPPQRQAVKLPPVR